MSTATSAPAAAARDREADILDAALAVLARDGIGGVTMRAVAREAEVSLGLANYYFTDKTSLVCAALRRIGEQDLEIVRPPDDGRLPARPMSESLPHDLPPLITWYRRRKALGTMLAVVVLTGGETMLDAEEFFALTRACREEGLSSAANTNGIQWAASCDMPQASEVATIWSLL